MGLTTVILTNKPQKNINSVVASISFSDEILIYPCGVIANFAAQRNQALKLAKNDWVLFVDDDEEVKPKLAREIQTAINKTDFSGFYLRRLDQYHHQVLLHGETGSIKLLRLAKKNAGAWVRPVHEIWQVAGATGELAEPLIHNRAELTTPFIERVIFYGPIDAKALTTENKPFSYWRLLFNPLVKFMVNYQLRLGFLDGTLGLFQAYLMSIQSLSVRVFQWSEKS